MWHDAQNFGSFVRGTATAAATTPKTANVIRITAILEIFTYINSARRPYEESDG